MIGFLARKGLFRQRTRTGLAVLGVGVSGALLLDMQMLSRGLQVSLHHVLRDIGYEVRVTPRGTLPFETEASFEGGHAIAAVIAADPRVERVAPVLGGTAYAARPGGSAQPIFVYGMDPPTEALWSIMAGQSLDSTAPAGAVLSATLARDLAAGIGDTLYVARGFSAALGMLETPRAYVVRGLADFRFDLRNQRSLAVLTREAQTVRGVLERDELSMLVIGLHDRAASDAVAAWIRDRFPQVEAYSVREMLDAVQGQLAYFNLFSVVLGGVSLVVCVLLVGTIITLSIGERSGEMAILRAIGVRRRRIVGLVIVEGLLLVVLSLPIAFGAGHLIALWLDGILRQAPSIPSDLHFFVLTGRAAGRTLLLLFAAGCFAGVYPAWLVSRHRIAATLHREVMG